MSTLRRWRWEAANYISAMMATRPDLWYKFDESSGATAVNSGSMAGANCTITGTTTLNQNGLKGRKGFLYDGATSTVQKTGLAALGAQTAFTYMSIIYPTSAGESNVGRFITCYAVGGGIQRRVGFNNVSRTMQASVSNTVAGTAGCSTTTTLALNKWYSVFFTFDDNGDRKTRIYIGSDGSLIEANYGSQSALTGTLYTSAVDFIIGNVSAVATFAGVIDETANWGRVLSFSEMSALVKASGV